MLVENCGPKGLCNVELVVKIYALNYSFSLFNVCAQQFELLLSGFL